MAYGTTEQSDAMHQLTAEYGKPDRVAIEETNEPYGIVWIRWFGAGRLNPERNLFIRPDGTRLAWRHV